ncbi:hypothetical protein [Sphingomonas sp. 3P27F8]|uniref:hypothetical protein n=1 Tax=Sphingomonas sp. 3P27F8 TaxID=2502213 RepID=UPI0010F64C72|nr:hypothetical protein [Sphingomonas sp. 3P27F8]
MKKMILGLAGVMAVSAMAPSAADAQRWNDGNRDHREWRGDRGHHRGWDRGRGWHRGPQWRRVCEWRGRYKRNRVCYRVRAW